MLTLPTLYKRSSDGKLLVWNISVDGATITTSYGDEGGKQQEAPDTVKAGKNLGKKNATTPEEQAEVEARAKWVKQVERRGYVKSRERALAGESDAEGGINPMLAKHYFEQGTTNLKDGKKIAFPALLQPKLDGIRCVAVVEDGACTLWTRTRKLIASVPHVNRAYERHFGKRDAVVDGELYSMRYADNFEHVVHLVRQEVPCEGHEEVEHHVYDLPSSQASNAARVCEIEEEFARGLGGPIIRVPTVEVENHGAMMVQFRRFLAAGYEGAIVRNRAGLYANKRSFDLQKVVETITEEFAIAGVEEGDGKLAGCVGSFVCVAKNGCTFRAKMEGDLGRLRAYFEDESLWRGKVMTVRYRTLTRKNQVPRFPVAVAVRDYE